MISIQTLLVSRIPDMYAYNSKSTCSGDQSTVSRYYHRQRDGARRAAHKAADSQTVYDAFIAHHGNFGRRMLKRILEKDHIVLSEYKISRILKSYALCSKYGRKRCRNIHTSKNTEKYIQNNLLAGLSPEKRACMDQSVKEPLFSSHENRGSLTD